MSRDFLNGYPNYRGVLWKNGQAIDLGALPGLPRSTGVSINTSEQIVGDSASQDFSVVHAMLWENGGPIVDLNALISDAVGITLEVGWVINERGEILAEGTVPSGDTHTFVLIPEGNCDDACETRINAGQNAAPVILPSVPAASLPPEIKSGINRPAQPFVQTIEGRF